MNIISSPKICVGLKKIRTFFLWGIICVLIGIGFGVWAWYISSQDSEAVLLHHLIVQNEPAGKYAELEVASRPYAFAEYDGKEEKYYFLFDGEDLMYVAYLPRDMYLQLNTADIEDHPIKIYGKTKTIPEDIRKLAIEVFNEEYEEDFLTEENFNDYLGTVYLDNTEKAHDYSLQALASTISLVLGLCLIIIGTVNRHQTKKSVEKFSKEEWQMIEQEVESDSCISYNSLNLHFTENYVVSLASGIDIFKYTDIVWMYPHILRQYGITTSKDIILTTLDKRKHTIANVSNFSKKSREEYQDVMSFIYAKNPTCIVGYTKENIQMMKEKYGIK